MNSTPEFSKVFEEESMKLAPKRCRRCHEEFGPGAHCQECAVGRHRKIKKPRGYFGPKEIA